MSRYEAKPNLTEEERFSLADALGQLLEARVISITREGSKVIITVEDSVHDLFEEIP